MQTADCRALSQYIPTAVWRTNETVSLNVLIPNMVLDLRSVHGTLTSNEVDAMVARARHGGGVVSYATLPDGTKVASELRLNMYSGMRSPKCSDEGNLASAAIAAVAIVLSLSGSPIVEPDSSIAIGQTSKRMSELELLRTSRLELAGAGIQEAVDLGSRVFGLLRVSPINPMDRVLCLINISNEHELVSPDFRGLLGTRNAVHDLVKNRTFNVHGPSFMLQPYQVCWLTA